MFLGPPDMMVHGAGGQEQSPGAEGRTDHLGRARPHLLVVTGRLRVEHRPLLCLVLVAPEGDGTIPGGGGEVERHSGGGAGAEVEGRDGARVLGRGASQEER